MKTNERIILCSNCGTKNRLPEQFEKQPKCGNCGKALAVGGIKGSFSRFATAALAICVLGFGVFVLNITQKTAKHEYNTATASSNPPKDIIEVDSDLNLIPVPIYPGVIKRSKAEAVAPLSFNTSPGFNYYVKLVDRSNFTVMTIYMRGGTPFETLVPLGTYEIRYASGNSWYGESNLFGKNTAFSKINDPFEFTFDGNQYSGFTVELIMQRNGNMRTRQISPNDF